MSAPDETRRVFYDSTDIARIPDGAWAALYADGDYKAPPTTHRRFPRRRWITVLGNPVSGIADYEPGNQVFDTAGALHRWATAREVRSVPIVYSDRAEVREALAELDGIRVLWWIATLDGRDWTPEELAADLAVNFGAHVPAEDIWACQNTDTKKWDRSVLFGDWWA
jgi:hypothetical protein